jgi:hypothetical protein
MDAVQASFDCSDLENPMGETSKDALRVHFNQKLKLEFHGTKVTSDAGLLAYREIDEALGLTTMSELAFYDNRKGKNTQHNITALLRQLIYSYNPRPHAREFVVLDKHTLYLRLSRITTSTTF